MNALLNFGFALNAGLLERALACEGLDATAGLLHEDKDGRASLASDAVELLRSDVGRRVVRWLRACPVSQAADRPAGSRALWRRRGFEVDRDGAVWPSRDLALAAAERLAVGADELADVLAWVVKNLNDASR